MSLANIMLASLAVAAGPIADEQETSTPAVQRPHPAVVPAGPDPVYPADFYAPFQPQTALDMLERTPGFLLTEGSSLRGFGGAAGNVLIDGQRPTVKAGGISQVLRRISASRVERILLLRGADAAEAQGQTLVANVVLRADAGGSGNAALTLNHTADGRISPSAQISHARRIAGWQTNVELSGEVVRYPTDGLYLDRDAAGAIAQTRFERIKGKAPELGLAASASGAVAGGALTVNLRLNKDGYQSDRSIDIFAGVRAGTPQSVRTIAYEEKGKSGELGLDWTRTLGKGWTTKLVGLARLEDGTTDEHYAEPGYEGVSALKQKPLELVGRTTLTREGDHAVRPELGVEIAYNRLSSRLDYAEDVGNGLSPVTLANADTRVSELRGEAFANLTVRVARRLNVESGMAFEMSRIRVTGDFPNEQSLSYWKPSAALVWSPSGRTQIRVGARRTVDQLDFGDFAASVNQADGRPLGGNAGLRPARVTRALARIDHRWGQGGAIAVEAYHQWHQGLLGYLLLPSGDEALGTIGNARQWSVSGQATLPLDAAIRGARLTLDGTLRGSRLRDRVTGRIRTMDDIPSRSLTAEFRHDVPALRSSWGVTYTAAERGHVYYISERLTWRDDALWGAYVETTALAGFKTTLKASAINGQDTHRLRRFYTPSRAGMASGQEQRDQWQGAILSLTLARAL
ncbi:TonB-dependent receptor plug domain-containing protein [Sphingobium rhizovicinum]|uniref:TonB-dependent receptor plug domain-containing protein n=1 Tax=Sphingobium rhizovicinum TaxID=432308 RepID=A0ABV7NLF6_9SPHN